MNIEKNKTILWLKRLVGLLFITLWIVVLFNIFQDGGSMQDQAPKCIFSTMLIFGFLTIIFKGLEYWERSSTK